MVKDGKVTIEFNAIVLEHFVNRIEYEEYRLMEHPAFLLMKAAIEDK